MNTILCGDAFTIVKTLPSESIQMCVTSPPYYGLRDYQVDGQIGLESTPFEYVSKLVEVFREVRRVLTNQGVLWLNIGDSYSVGKGFDTIKPKNMLGIPWALAFALRDDGWFLRSNVIWHKPNAMPESVTDRPAKCYEHLFLLSKSPNYYFDNEAIKQPVADGTIERMKRGMSANHKYSVGAPGQTLQTLNKPRKKASEQDLPTMRNSRDIWSIPTKAYKGAHFATFPTELATKCILCGCPENGIVLDPFFGSGTTGVAAILNDRQYIGIDINPDFCRLASSRIENTAKLKGVGLM